MTLAFIVLAGNTLAPATTVDLKPLLDQVVWPLVGAVLAALATFLTTKLAQWLKLKSSAMLQATVEAALNNGLQLAQAKVATLNISNIGVQSEIVAQAAAYAIARAPDALKSVGIDTTTPQGLAAVRDQIEARLAPAVLVGAASPLDLSVGTAATIANPSIATGPVEVTSAAPPIGTQAAKEVT
ncbi:MAG TPA: hypothetical protein VK634_06885 [Reyranella sp.]|nr:hypothetical protein [Reyranella sp.]HTE80400.1 hypothetical protein [Reyranella sp.]